MRLVTSNGLSEVLTIFSIFMNNSDPNPCTPEEQIFVKATELDGQSALFFCNNGWTRAAWVCKDAVDDSYLVLFQDRDDDEDIDVIKRPTIGRFRYCNLAGPDRVEHVVSNYIINDLLDVKLNLDHLQRLSTSVKKAAS